MPQRWPLQSREDYEDSRRDIVDGPDLDDLIQPLLVDVIDRIPDAVRLFAGGNHLTVESLPDGGEAATLYTLPSHVRERAIERLRFAAQVFQSPFNISQDGMILATYKGTSYDITINYTTRFYGRDEILTFRAYKADEQSNVTDA